MFREQNKNSGMTLVEMLVATGVTGIVMIGAMQLISDYLQQAWGQESIADAMQSKETIANILRYKVPPSISDNSVTDPVANTAIWNCSTDGPCKFISSKTNGVEITVTCQSVSNLPIFSQAPFASVANVGDPGKTNCSHCSSGFRPIMTVKQFKNGTETQTLTFPGATKTKGEVGMGLCFAAPPYVDEDGTTKWDQWKITIVPVYFVAPPKASDSTERYAAILKANPEELMISGLTQLGSKTTSAPSAGGSGKFNTCGDCAASPEGATGGCKLCIDDSWIPVDKSCTTKKVYPVCLPDET